MKYFKLILLLTLLFSCSKRKFEPVRPIQEEGIVYLITVEYDPVINHQKYATNEAEIKLICENYLPREFRYIGIDYVTGLVYYEYYERGWCEQNFKLYTFQIIE